MSLLEENGYSRSASVDIDGLCDALESQMTIEEPPLTIYRYPGFEKYPCHVNWISDEDKLTKRMVQVMINVLNDKVNENTQDGDSTLKYLGIESVCFRTCLAFLNALIDKDVDAQRHLIQATSDITSISEFNYVEDEYLEGLRYVLKGVNIYNGLQRSRRGHIERSNGKLDIPLEEVQAVVGGLQSLEGLSDKGRIGVLAAQHYFDGTLRREHAMQIEFLKRIIEKDPDYYLWRFNLYSQYRFQRREKYDRNRTGPTNDEVVQIQKAVELAPHHPLILVGNCICVAEMMKTHGSDGCWRKPMKYGEKEFKSIQAVVDFIKLQTKKILDAHQETVRINIHISECFSFLLPHEYRDMEFAKQCIERALQFHPNSSKAHHRMGNFILMTSGDVKEATERFAQAVESDSRNFPAKADLMKAYMFEAQENAEKILQLIDKELENPDHNSNRLASIHFLKGCFYLLIQDDRHQEHEINAALEWLKACEIASDSLDFKSLTFMAKRYKWPKGKLTHKVLAATIQSLVKSGKVDASNENFIKLEKLAQRNRDEAQQHYQQTRSANNTGRGGYAARGGNRPAHGMQRRRSESLMETGTSGSGDGTAPLERTRRPRRWSNSLSEDSGGMKVVLVRQPRPPQGPGFSFTDRDIGFPPHAASN